MPYSDFTLKRVKQQLNVQIIENQDLFARVESINISEYLAVTLAYNVPLALAVGTEKARSELIIANVLLEVRRLLNDKISLFSGINLDVDKQRDLSGFCDFVISKSAEQYYLNAPLIAVVEAKNESITNGLGQCIAAMYAANVFNEQEGSTFPQIYGAVTTGNTWKFLKYEAQTAYIDVPEYHITHAGKIINVLVNMAQQTA